MVSPADARADAVHERRSDWTPVSANRPAICRQLEPGACLCDRAGGTVAR